jgi:outer membrane protein assembly factor BamE (lipoprotein component of BamABCDE complex)
MKRTILASLVVSFAVLGLSGCASNNNDSSNPPPPKQADKPKDNRPLDQRLTVGMSRDDVIAACGKPRNRFASSDGESWEYDDREKAFMPFYGVSGGQITYTTIIFDADGKVKSWSSSSHGRYN